MNKKQRCYECGCILKGGQEYDICNRCALLKNDGDTKKQEVNATRIKKRRKPSDE